MRKQILPFKKRTYFSATPYTPRDARTHFQAAPLPHASRLLSAWRVLALLPFLCSDSVPRFYGFLCQLPQGYSLEWTHLWDD